MSESTNSKNVFSFKRNLFRFFSLCCNVLNDVMVLVLRQTRIPTKQMFHFFKGKILHFCTNYTEVLEKYEKYRLDSIKNALKN